MINQLRGRTCHLFQNLNSGLVLQVPTLNQCVRALSKKKTKIRRLQLAKQANHHLVTTRRLPVENNEQK